MMAHSLAVSEAFTLTPSSLTDGSHTINVRATDSASNVTALADYGTQTFIIDTTAPAVSLASIVSLSADATPFTGTATDVSSTISSVEYQIDRHVDSRSKRWHL